MRRTQHGPAAILVIVALAVTACQEPGARATQVDERVSGVGILFKDADGTVRLCASAVVPAPAGPPLVGNCYPPDVPVAGAPDSAFTVKGDGRASSDSVRVEGVYRDGTVSVDKVQPGEGPIGTEPAALDVPCDAPPGGWRTTSVYTDGADLDRARVRLAQVVDADPETYAGRRMGYPDDRRTGASVLVVGTVRDVERARRAVSAVYQDNLCVYSARFSAADLDRTVAELEAGGVTAEADVTANRVRVRPVILDAPTNHLFDQVGREALVIDDPLLAIR
ncbi:hypothetical protein ACTMTJ_15300 [Phytohabitans sp. LJ34]|uniref:hypothetical protein n=1 Tax=Phytohabitans sp. LJ34 TaxID=3452217 RepID=UPI003F890CE7